MPKHLIPNYKQFSDSEGFNLSQEIEFNQDLFQVENYCKKHRAFISLSAQKTIELEAFASALKSLSIRWVENKDACLVDAEVELFKGLIEELRSISGTIQAASSYLNKSANDSTNTVCFSPMNEPLNILLLDWIILLNQDEQTIRKFLSVASSLRIAVGLLSSDLLSAGIEPDGNKPRFGSRLLLAATAMVNESASTSRAAVNLMQSEEKHWQKLGYLLEP